MQEVFWENCQPEQSFFHASLAQSALVYRGQKKIYGIWTINTIKWKNAVVFMKRNKNNGGSLFTIHLQSWMNVYYRNCKKLKLIKKEQNKAYNLPKAGNDWVE